mgnify:CR=1 FL=1
MISIKLIYILFRFLITNYRKFMICKAHEIDGVIISAQSLNGHSTSDIITLLKYKKVHFYHKI